MSRPTALDVSRVEPADLRPAQLAWLAAAVFVVSAGYGALLPLLPGWLTSIIPIASGPEVARHVGFLSGVYAAGVLIGAPLWGIVSDRTGRSQILIVGFIGYVASLLLLLVPAFSGLWGLYALRGMTGFFVAAVVPVVSALVAENTPDQHRARRFAWLGAVSLLGFLFGPALNVVADVVARWTGEGLISSARAVIVLSALSGAVMMVGLNRTLPALGTAAARAPARTDAGPAAPSGARLVSMWWVSGTVMFVLAGFELGIVLQGQQQAVLSARQAAMMLAECSLVMLAINAILFFAGLLEKVPSRTLLAAGIILAVAGLAVLTIHRSAVWMYLGVSLTAAGTGLILPVVAYLAAGASFNKLGATMGGLAAAAGFGQTLGSAFGGWLFGSFAQGGFGWLGISLVVLLGFLWARRDWCADFPRRTPQPPRSAC